MTKHKADRSLKSLLEILFVSTRLGLTSFGGPIAHLGYFHAQYVRKENGWTKKLCRSGRFMPVSARLPAARWGSESA